MLKMRQGGLSYLSSVGENHTAYKLQIAYTVYQVILLYNKLEKIYVCDTRVC